MIEFIVLIILILFVVYLAMPLFSSVPLFLINASLIVIIATRAKVDIKELDMLLHYLIAAFITVFIFVARDRLSFIFDFMNSILILELTQALLYIFFIAHLLRIVQEGTKEIILMFKKQTKKHK